MDLSFSFANKAQREFYYSTARNQLFSGGFNNGKTFALCLKMTTLLLTFQNYRAVMARQTFTDLKKTTMQTFFKMFPTELIESHNEQEGLTILKNSSMIYWLHLDKVDEKTLRGLEANSIGVDQAEETDEKVFDVLDARLGRWDGAIVPPELLSANPTWPRSKLTGRPIAPSYHMMLANPDTQFHYLYRKFHPDSQERKKKFFYVEGEWDPQLGSIESYNEAMSKDPEWVAKYVKGQWGLSSASIHFVRSESLLEWNFDLIQRIKQRGALYRILDHGDSAPTCCLWMAALDGIYIFYREYYMPNRVISEHRQNIDDLSFGEEYQSNYADPQIFKKTAQKDGGFWSVADEYGTDAMDTRDRKIPVLTWQPADNNEFATRNRINELLKLSEGTSHPVTKASPAPRIYFIKKSDDYPFGMSNAITQTGAQRKTAIGTIEGKTFYSDDRDEGITDHAYDCVRYAVAMHGSPLKESKPKPRKNTFAYFNTLLKSKEIRGFQPNH